MSDFLLAIMVFTGLMTF